MKEWRLECALRPGRPRRPWTAARTTNMLRQCPLVIAQQLVYYAIAVSTAAQSRVTRTMSGYIVEHNLGPSLGLSDALSPQTEHSWCSQDTQSSRSHSAAATGCSSPCLHHSLGTNRDLNIYIYRFKKKKKIFLSPHDRRQTLRSQTNNSDLKSESHIADLQ